MNNWLALDMYMACITSLSTHFVLNLWDVIIIFLGFGVLVNFVDTWFFDGCSLANSLNHSILSKFVSPLISLNTLAHIATQVKSSWLLCAYCISNGGEFENFTKHMVDCIFSMSLE